MSSSAGDTPAAAVAMIYQLGRTANTCNIAVTVMLVYDYVLCLDREYQYVWRSRKSKASRLVYLFIRYISLLNYVMSFTTIQPVSDTSCVVLGWCLTCLGYLGMIGPAILTTLRTYVLSGRNKLLGGVAMTLSLGPFLMDVSTIYQALPVNLPPPENCSAQNAATTSEVIGFTVAARSCAILADLITIVVTWRATRTSREVLQDTFKQPSLQDILWTNGNIYFITLLFVNLLDLILATLSIIDLQSNENWVGDFLDVIPVILDCRFLLDLYETNARLERGGSSLSQSNIGIGSLHFTGIGAPEAPDSPEDSPFLSSFSGPVLHSFPDDMAALDTADDDPESVPAQTTAPATETAAGGSSSAWRADTTWGPDIAGGSGFAGGSGMAV